MNDYIVYTAEGFTSGPNTNFDVENCQILGVIEGASEEDAIKKLFEQNKWIQQAGFTISKALAHPVLTDSIKEKNT